jgi:hypothetical protein
MSPSDANPVKGSSSPPNTSYEAVLTWEVFVTSGIPIVTADKIESLNPRAAVAAHKRPEKDNNPQIIEETRRYIRDFDRLAQTTKTAQELDDKMLELYPNRVNPAWALWSSARAVKPPSQAAGNTQ